MNTTPKNSYLSSRYYDPKRRLEVLRVFYEDGRVKAFDGREWWTVCRFTEKQVERAKTAVRNSGLFTASDLKRDGIHDTALVTYYWNIDNASGRVTNWIYPAERHPVFIHLDEKLDALEAEAGAEWRRLMDELPDED